MINQINNRTNVRCWAQSGTIVGDSNLTHMNDKLVFIELLKNNNK